MCTFFFFLIKQGLKAEKSIAADNFTLNKDSITSTSTLLIQPPFQTEAFPPTKSSKTLIPFPPVKRGRGAIKPLFGAKCFITARHHLPFPVPLGGTPRPSAYAPQEPQLLAVPDAGRHTGHLPNASTERNLHRPRGRVPKHARLPAQEPSLPPSEPRAARSAAGFESSRGGRWARAAPSSRLARS